MAVPGTRLERPALTSHQNQKLDSIIAALEAGHRIVALDGQAGTGKTTVLGRLAELRRDVVLAAATNRAAAVLSLKIDRPVKSMHAACMRPVFREPGRSLNAWIEELAAWRVYKPWPAWCGIEDRWQAGMLELAGAIAATGNENGARSVLRFRKMDWVERWEPREPQGGLLVVDEASMVGAEALAMAKAVFNRILLAGDTRQLPPVKDSPVFWQQTPRFTLREVHRQRDGADVLRLADLALATGALRTRKVRASAEELFRTGTPILCWRNATRIRLTEAIRTALGFCPDKPAIGERLTVRTSGTAKRTRGLYNNALVTCVGHERSACVLADEAGNEYAEQVSLERGGSDIYPDPGLTCRSAFALTAHNAQGGEWPLVLVHADDARVLSWLYSRPEKRAALNAPAWFYTAITRAKGEVLLFEGLAGARGNEHQKEAGGSAPAVSRSLDESKCESR